MKKIGILTLGCRVNQYESGAISEELTALGFNIQPFNTKCDCYIINTCAVTEESVRKSRQAVRRAVKANKEAFTVVCGCASQYDKEAFLNVDGVDFVYGVRNKNELIKAVKEHFEGREIEKNSVKEPEGALVPTHISRFDRTRAYVKIQDGCENKCAYCIIPSLRGGIVIRDENEIVSEVKDLALNGCHEVVLTGIETAAYGKGLGRLIKKISGINGIERIRMGSLEPSFVKAEFINEIAQIPQVCHHFHLSVQNGSDNVLRSMRRRYNVKMLEENIACIKRAMPDANLSADIIVGFPAESEEDFKSTCDFVRRNGFLHLHIFAYSKRKGTEAEIMPNQIPEEIKKQRLHILTDIANEIRDGILESVISEGKPLSILCETLTDGKISGHTDNFIECLVETDIRKIDEIKGKIIKALPLRNEDGRLVSIMQ